MHELFGTLALVQVAVPVAISVGVVVHCVPPSKIVTFTLLDEVVRQPNPVNELRLAKSVGACHWTQTS